MLVFSPEPWEGHPRCTHHPRSLLCEAGIPWDREIGQCVSFLSNEAVLWHHAYPSPKPQSQMLQSVYLREPACRKPQLCRQRRGGGGGGRLLFLRSSCPCNTTIPLAEQLGWKTIISTGRGVSLPSLQGNTALGTGHSSWILLELPI